MDKFDMMEAEMRAEEWEIRMEKGGDDYLDYDEPRTCPECEEGCMIANGRTLEDTDADGRRGRYMRWFKCDECGFEEGSYE